MYTAPTTPQPTTTAQTPHTYTQPATKHAHKQAQQHQPNKHTSNKHQYNYTYKFLGTVSYYNTADLVFVHALTYSKKHYFQLLV